MALIPPSFLNTVVALGGPSQDGNIQYTATGFLYGYPIAHTEAHEVKQYRIFLVTNRHVFNKAFERKTALQARFNRPMGAGANVYPLRLNEPDGSASWIVHPDPDVDVAVINVNPQRLQQDGIEFSWFPSDTQTFSLEQARATEVSEGEWCLCSRVPIGNSW